MAKNNSFRSRLQRAKLKLICLIAKFAYNLMCFLKEINQFFNFSGLRPVHSAFHFIGE
jgi:hypothetical protein